MKSILALVIAASFAGCSSLCSAGTTDIDFDPKPVLRNGQWGYLKQLWDKPESEFPVLAPFAFDYATTFEHADTATVFAKGKAGLVDRSGKLVVPAVFDFAWPFVNDRAIVYRGGKFGAVDRQGRLVVPLHFDLIWDFKKGGRAAAVQGSNWGLIGGDGSTLMPFEFALMAVADQGTQRGYKDGMQLFGTAYQRFPAEKFPGVKAAEFDEYPNVIVAKREGKRVLVDWSGEPLFNGTYDEINYDDKHQIAIVVRDERMAAYDVQKRTWISPTTYKSVTVQENGWLRVVTAVSPPKAFFTDRSGKNAFGTEFDDAMNMERGFVKVRRGAQWGVLDSKGRQIVPFVARRAEHISIEKDWIAARGELGWGAVDHDGRQILAFEYEGVTGPSDISPFHFSSGNDVFESLRHTPSNRYGAVDDKLNWAVPLGTYDELGVARFSGVVEVRRGSRHGAYDIKARREIIPPSYGIVFLEGDFASARRDREGKSMEYFAAPSWRRIEPPDRVGIADVDQNTQRLVVYQGDEPGNCKNVPAGTRVGLADLNGHLLTPLEYMQVLPTAGDKLFLAVKNGRTGYIDPDGKTVIPFEFDYDPDPMNPICSTSLQGGYALLKQRGEWVLVEKGGRVAARQSQFAAPDAVGLLPDHVGSVFVFTAVMGRDLSSRKLKFILNGHLYDRPGGSENPSGAGESLTLREGLLAARRNGKYGYLDYNGREVLPFQYEEAHSFNGGTAYVKQDGKWWIINRDGTRLQHLDGRYVFLAARKN